MRPVSQSLYENQIMTTSQSLSAPYTLYNNYDIQYLTWKADFDTNAADSPTPDSQYGLTSDTVDPFHEGELVTRPADPTKSGYQFTGWYADAACTIIFNFTQSPTENITIYAGWEKEGGGITGRPTSPGSLEKSNPSQSPNGTIKAGQTSILSVKVAKNSQLPQTGDEERSFTLLESLGLISLAGILLYAGLRKRRKG